MTDKEKIEKAINFIRFSAYKVNEKEEPLDTVLYILMKKTEKRTCVWTLYSGGYYDTQCGWHVSSLHKGRYCLYCGGKIIIKGRKE